MYWLLFLPGIALPSDAFEALPFDSLEELSRIFLRDMPALLLIAIAARGSFVAGSAISPDPFSPPTRADVMPAALSFLALVGISAAAGVAASYVEGSAAEAFLEPPLSPAAWAAALAACVSTGYLEEAFFRAYLLSRLERLGIGRGRAVAIAVAMFAVCHLYEGVWGVVNAAAAGVFLSLVFLRARSLHATAWAHAAYNIFVYVSYS